MSLADFCNLTISEWNEVYASFIKRDEERIHSDWELMRVHAFLVLQPNIGKKSRNTITPEKLWPLPWDKNKKESKNIVSRDIQKERYHKLLERIENASRRCEDRCETGREGADAVGHEEHNQEGDNNKEGKV